MRNSAKFMHERMIRLTVKFYNLHNIGDRLALAHLSAVPGSNPGMATGLGDRTRFGDGLSISHFRNTRKWKHDLHNIPDSTCL